VAKDHHNVRILAVVSSDFEAQIQRNLISPDMSPVFVSRAEELGSLVRNGEVYEVALLPVVLPEGIDWWTIWGELAQLTRRPAILVYAQSANFHLWAEVLDAGGYDVVAEPFTREMLREAVLRAAWSFDQKREMGGEEDLPDHE
jgi:DNA-binding NtrC family response regulator